MSRTLSLQERRDERNRPNHRRTRSAGTFPISASTSEAPSRTRGARGHASRRSDPVSLSTPELLQRSGEAVRYPAIPVPTAVPPGLTIGRGPAVPSNGERVDNPPPPRAPIWDVPLFEDGRRAATNVNTGGEGNHAGGGRPPDPPRGFLGKLLELLGYAGQDAKARRALVSLVFAQLWWFAQVRLALSDVPSRGTL
ncbi:hypothetical protein OH76DRAFT_871369 [Lentinus brumalis]|uniref:Uncharacterized protein n=1 Tax=Lentinus brumalis TaxID=2498619 RepID=A0A371DRK0_9APHY|nr:hypothetical protein OH76DRAFT_871369 [Polyporus brumalis]